MSNGVEEDIRSCEYLQLVKKYVNQPVDITAMLMILTIVFIELIMASKEPITWNELCSRDHSFIWSTLLKHVFYKNKSLCMGGGGLPIQTGPDIETKVIDKCHTSQALAMSPTLPTSRADGGCNWCVSVAGYVHVQRKWCVKPTSRVDFHASDNVNTSQKWLWKLWISASPTIGNNKQFVRLPPL